MDMEFIKGVSVYEGIGYFILLLVLVDFILLLVNIGLNRGPGGCAKDGWITFGITTAALKGVPCSESSSGKGECKDLGRWREYSKDGKGKEHEGCLCRSEVDVLYKSIVEDNIVSGYNVTELLAYVIVPFITVVGIVWGLISTSLSKAEWTFWIIIATLIFTSLTSLAYDTDLAVLPDQGSPLSYISDKLDLQGTDELKYSFIARKQDGKECFVEGTMLGGGVSPENQPPTYSGYCTSETLPLY